jgi:hypothetical protein
MQLTHRTEQADHRIRNAYVPTRTIARGTAEHEAESALGAAMLPQALKDGHTRQRTRGNSKSCNKPQQRPVDDVSPAILCVLRQKLLASKIVELISIDLGRKVSPQVVRDRLLGCLT